MRYAAIALLAALACPPAGAALEPVPPTIANAPRPVLVQTVRFEQGGATRSLPGVVRARTETDLGFRVPGKVTRRLVDAGAVVRTSEPLALLDPTDLALQAAQADAEYAAAKIARDTTAAEMARVRALRKAGWSTGSDADRQAAAAADAAGRFERAERARSLAHNAAEYGTLRADADGVVTATMAEPGQVVTAGQPVVRLAHLGEREVAVAIPETLVASARAPATATFWALPGVAVTARLRELSPTANEDTRTYGARYALPDAPEGAMLGMTATVSLRTDAVPAARVPLGAVADQGFGPVVFVVDGTRVAARPVTVARMDATDAWITAGLADGDVIVAAGAQKLDPTTAVRVVSKLDR